MTRVREPAVAGSFYPGRPDALHAKLASLLPGNSKRTAKAVLVPHAGYDYSGPIAGSVLSRVEIPRNVIVLSFSHRGIGPAFGIWGDGAWRTPLGDAPIAEELVIKLKAAFPALEEDERGFQSEHSGEVQVPFLQKLRPDVRIVPVELNASQGGGLEEFGAALASVVTDELVVATTDLTHCGAAYGIEPPVGMSPRDFARSQDRAILKPIAALSIEDFFDTRSRMGISMCGVAPTAAFIAFGRARGAREAELVSYGTSADDEPNADRAVGYPGVIIW